LKITDTGWNSKREKDLLGLNILKNRCREPAVAMECIVSIQGGIQKF
jgi:hypothetical protein